MRRCSHCHYQWRPKVKNPLRCPRCKRLDWQPSLDKRLAKTVALVAILIGVIGVPMVLAYQYHWGIFGRQIVSAALPKTFTVTCLPNQNLLQWTYDNTSEMHQIVEIIYSLRSVPQHPADGITLYRGNSGGFAHDNLTSGQMIYYSMWAVRETTEHGKVLPVYSDGYMSCYGIPL